MNRNLLLVTLSLGVWGIGEGFFIYFQPLYLQEWGADPILIGGVFSIMGFAAALAQIPAGYLSDRFGARSIMWASWIFGALATWVMALANSLPLFIVGVVLYGFTGFVVAPMNSYISTMRGKLTVGRALSIPSAAFNLGAVLGPIIGGVIADHLGFQSVYLIAAVLFIFSTIMIFFIKKENGLHEEDQNSTNQMGLLKTSRFLMFLGIALVTLFALYLPQPFIPSYLQNQQHLNSTTIGILGAFGSLGSALAMFFISHLNSVTGFLISQLMLMVSAILFLEGKSVALFALGYLFVGGYRLCRAMNLAIVRSLIHPSETGLAFGVIETVSAVVLIIAPILAGFLYHGDPYSIYKVALILLIGVFIINLVVFSVIKVRKVRKT